MSGDMVYHPESATAGGAPCTNTQTYMRGELRQKRREDPDDVVPCKNSAD